MNETTDTLEPKRHRGPGSLPFLRADAKPIWREYPRLALIAEECGLTERQADVLLYYRALELPPSEIGEWMGIQRKHVWRYIKQVNNKLRERYSGEMDDEVAWYRDALRGESNAILSAVRNSRGSSRTPIYYMNGNGLWRAWTSPVMVLAEDLRRPVLQPIDVA